MKIPILFYHKIDSPVSQAKEKSLYVAVESFERQMKYLKWRNYTPIHLGELLKILKGEQKPAFKPIVITFDDGYEDNYTYAFPVLKKFGFKATIFLVTRDIGKVSGVWMNSHEKLKTKLLNWEQIKEMHKWRVDFQSHTHSHTVLTRLNDKGIKNELTLSKQIIEEKLGSKVNFLCYPRGDFDERVKELVRKTGYSGAVTTIRGMVNENADLFALKRIGVKCGKKIWNFINYLTFKYR